MPASSTKTNELAELRAEVAELRERMASMERAVPELGLSTYTDAQALLPTSPFHGSGHVRQKLIKYAPNFAALAERYLAETTDTYLAETIRKAEAMQQTGREAERGRAEGADVTSATSKADEDNRAAMYARTGLGR